MLKPAEQTPDLDLPLTNGARFRLSEQYPKNFTMLVFYRGKHCPICKKYLSEIGSKLGDIAQRGINPVAISMDSEERASVSHEEWDTADLPLAFDLTEEEARRWGLYISRKREGSEEPETFSEPGLFLLDPKRSLYFAVTQNAPFTRPSIDELLGGIDYVLKNDYPTRGTLT